MSDTVPLIDFFGDKSKDRIPSNFNIPHYQRGYRWTIQEVTELLNDVWNFYNTSNRGEFYCLQPIVLQKNDDDSFNVLDGQQRLTTLYLILVYLEQRRYEDGYNQELFSLNYETRDDCEEFLREKRFVNEMDDTNIDFYHICKAYSCIDEWFNNPKHPGAKGKLIPILMDNTDKGNRNIRFIWYEVEEDINPIEVFIRLNVGKIPLTDAELTKALLLQSDKYEIEELKYIKMKLFEIASEWDTIEYTLQNEDFWYFINNSENEKTTHIEFILDLIAIKIEKGKRYFEERPAKHATFLILSEYIQDLIDNEDKTRIEAVELIWESITEYFEYFNEWFNSRTLFHFIGYLIALKGNNIIEQLISKSKELPKSKFEKHLIKEIGTYIEINKYRKDSSGTDIEVKLKDLNYENSNQQHDDIIEINRILLLHNVHSTLKCEKEKAQFPFYLYKQTKRNEKWSLEHIHAQKSENITKDEHRKTWLEDHIKSLSNFSSSKWNELIKKMKSIKAKDNIEDDEFDEIVIDVYTKVDKKSGINEKNKHSIDNLCLVDTRTNSLLNNSVFDVKREKIKQREVKGFYIPFCTRNVFLKAYSEYPANNAYWTETDRDGYLKSIQNTYDYFTESLNN